MLKISVEANGQWVDPKCPPLFQRQHLDSGAERLRLCIPIGRQALIRELLESLPPPVQILYVLHTPRGEGEPGRYQSPEIGAEGLLAFFDRFEAFLSADARHDIWVRSSADGAMIVWDRHNDLFVYRAVDESAARLRRLGFTEGAPPNLGPHIHHYRQEFDGDAAELLQAFDWRFSPLHPSDIQFKES